MSNFGKLIYELRKEKHLTQAELGDKLNLTDKAISRWETGESLPDISQLIPLSNLFDITIDELLKGERKPKQEDNNQINQEDISDKNKKEVPMNSTDLILLLSGLFLFFVGIMLVIIPSYSALSQTAGVFGLFICLAVGVILIVEMGMRKDLRGSELNETELTFSKKMIHVLALGIAICILCPTGLFVFSELVGLIYLFSFIAVGVALIIVGSTLKENTDKPHKKELNEKEKLSDSICGIIMILATIIYLILGFLWNLWHPGWIVYPVGGLLCAIVNKLIDIKK